MVVAGWPFPKRHTTTGGVRIAKTLKTVLPLLGEKAGVGGDMIVPLSLLNYPRTSRKWTAVSKPEAINSKRSD